LPMLDSSSSLSCARQEFVRPAEVQYSICGRPCRQSLAQPSGQGRLVWHAESGIAVSDLYSSLSNAPVVPEPLQVEGGNHMNVYRYSHQALEQPCVQGRQPFGNGTQPVGLLCRWVFCHSNLNSILSIARHVIVQRGWSIRVKVLCFFQQSLAQ
jgi:hypothetical protein